MENHNIKINVPITIPYTTLERAARAKMVGEYITVKEDTGEDVRYARIVGISIFGSRTRPYDITVAIRVNVLRTLLKRDNVDLYVQAALGYDNEREQLFLSKYHLDVRTQSSLYNAGLEVLANTVASNKIMGKSKVNLRQKIDKELQKVNGLLESGLEMKGVRLTGAVDQVSVQDLLIHHDRVTLQLMVSGNVAVEVLDVTSLVPPGENPMAAQSAGGPTPA